MCLSFFSKLKLLKLPKILVILGPTASGKTDLGIFLAKKFNGEVINADSRQIYKEMDIATAKPYGKLEMQKGVKQVYMVEGVPHYLMDIVDPNEEFTLANFKIEAEKTIADILRRGKTPIIVGGTGLYIWAVVDNLQIPKSKPNLAIRAELEKKTLSELTAMLETIDPESADAVDLKNPRRVLRALEVAIDSGRSFVRSQKKGKPLYNALQIGIECPREILYERINERVDKQIVEGLLDETKKLAEKYSWDLPSMSSIGYRQIGYFLQGKMDLPQAIEVLKRDTRHYAKRQMTWFKRDKRINWISKIDEAEVLIKKFLKY